MESPNPREFACYQRTKVRWQQCEGTWIVACFQGYMEPRHTGDVQERCAWDRQTV
jgi:hypothetical protein